MLVGVQRAGFVSFPISPRNSPAAVAYLLTKTSSEYVLVGAEQNLQDLFAATLQLMREENAPLPHQITMPTFEDLYVQGTDTYVPLPPLDADFDEPTVMMHSSGSSMICLLPTRF